MNIADLFVNLGIKGADKTVGALGSVKKGIGEVGSMSIEAKASILGMMYGLERMMAISGAAGTGLTNFTAFTGKSAQDLQKWQYAARQAGVGAEEMTGSVKAMQTAMSNMLMGKGAPEGIALMSGALGGINPKDYQDTFLMLKHYNDAIQKLPLIQGNIVGKGAGLSEGVIAAMRRGVFTPEMLAKAPTYSDKEIGSLDNSNVAWSNLGKKIEMAFGHFNARHGQQLVGDISKIADQVFRLADALLRVGNEMGVFEKLDKVVGFVADALESKEGTALGEKHYEKKLWNWITGGDTAEKDGKIPQKSGFDFLSKTGDLMSDLAKSGAALTPKVIIEKPQPVEKNVTTIQQTITHHGDAKDTQSVKDTHKHAITHAYRQRPAQRQGS